MRVRVHRRVRLHMHVACACASASPDPMLVTFTASEDYQLGDLPAMTFTKTAGVSSIVVGAGLRGWCLAD